MDCKSISLTLWDLSLLLVYILPLSFYTSGEGYFRILFGFDCFFVWCDDLQGSPTI